MEVSMDIPDSSCTYIALRIIELQQFSGSSLKLHLNLVCHPVAVVTRVLKIDLWLYICSPS